MEQFDLAPNACLSVLVAFRVKSTTKFDRLKSLNVPEKSRKTLSLSLSLIFVFFFLICCSPFNRFMSPHVILARVFFKKELRRRMTPSLAYTVETELRLVHRKKQLVKLSNN